MYIQLFSFSHFGTLGERASGNGYVAMCGALKVPYISKSHKKSEKGITFVSPQCVTAGQADGINAR